MFYEYEQCLNKNIVSPFALGYSVSLVQLTCAIINSQPEVTVS